MFSDISKQEEFQNAKQNPRSIPCKLRHETKENGLHSFIFGFQIQIKCFVRIRKGIVLLICFSVVKIKQSKMPLTETANNKWIFGDKVLG